MSRFSEAVERVRELRDRGEPMTAAHYTVDEVAAQGERWLMELLERHGIELDELIAAADENRDMTVKNIGFLLGLKRIPLQMALGAAYSAGYTNGLGVGLEYER